MTAALNFAGIFLLDAVSAINDFVMMIKTPKPKSRRKLYRIAKREALRKAREARQKRATEMHLQYIKATFAMTAKQTENQSSGITEHNFDEPREKAVSLVRGSYLPNHNFNRAVLEKLGITDEATVKTLTEANYYHFLTIQMRYNAFFTLFLSLLGLTICVVSFLSMDLATVNSWFGTDIQPGPLISRFAFDCKLDNPRRWDLDDP